MRRLHEASVRGVALRIAEDIVGSPFVTPTRASEKFDVTYETANSAIARLEKHGVIREATGRNYARVFMSPEIVEIVSR